MIIPGLRKRHLIILAMSAYYLQAIALADGPFRLNHSLFFAVKDNSVSGWHRSMVDLDKHATSLDKWSISRFGKDPWAKQGDMLAATTSDCVTTPSYGAGNLRPEEIHLYHTAKKKNLRSLGSPLCKTLSGDWRFTTNRPGVLFQVNPNKPNDYGIVQPND